MNKLSQSLLLKQKALKLIPGCSQTLSKGPSQFVQGIAPVFLERGRGSHVWDVDGNKFIDYSMALGPIILGYNYPAVVAAVKKQLNSGTTFSLPHRLEVELAELLCQIIPGAEMVRFAKNGSDATSGAVRLARAYTGRDKIACCGYHGWQDWYIGSTTRSQGVPEQTRKSTLTFEYNNIDSLRLIFKKNKDQIACVIMEPAGTIKPKDGYLAQVKKLTAEHKALLIFDEIISGFRLSLGGAGEFFGVTPDLACFGKAMGNGFPISAIVGQRKIMRLFEQVFFSFTFGGEAVSIAAAIATIKELRRKDVIQHLWKQGGKLKQGFNALSTKYGYQEFIQSVGLAPRTVVVFKYKSGRENLLLRSLFQQECIKRGLLFTGVHNVCLSHSDRDIARTLSIYADCFKVISRAARKNRLSKLLKAKPVKPVFRQV
ncbi:aminotransferase class III-fold pyridoxal phosphate-dependent enzyme [Candidatus Omnitrophota bacterium]